jgi:hypothetical protein
MNPEYHTQQLGQPTSGTATTASTTAATTNGHSSSHAATSTATTAATSAAAAGGSNTSTGAAAGADAAAAAANGGTSGAADEEREWCEKRARRRVLTTLEAGEHMGESGLLTFAKGTRGGQQPVVERYVTVHVAMSLCVDVFSTQCCSTAAAAATDSYCVALSFVCIVDYAQ